MTEIDVYRPRAEVAVPAANDTDSWVAIVQDILKIANVVYDTPFVPDGLRGSAPAVAAAMLAGREMGLGIMTSLANIDVIKGKPTQKALLMRAMIQGRGHKWVDGDVTDTRAVVRGCRRGESEWTEVAFTADQAKRAGIDLGKYPADKLYARASSRLARRKFADVIMGMPYTPEDMEDGLEDDEVGTVTEGTAPAIEAAKTRTAQRKQRTPSSPPAPAAIPVAVPAPSGAGGDLPPLPGEDEPGEAAGTPGDERHKKLVGIVQAHFKRLEYTDDEREQRLEVAAIIAGVDPIGSLNDLVPPELSKVADTLAKCRNRDALTALLVAQDGGRDGE